MSTTLTHDPTGSQLVPTIERMQDGTPVISSLVIAEGSGVQHKNVLELLETNRVDFEQFGQLAFQTRDRIGTPGPKQRVALLNEQQATLLMTYQRNTEQVKRFKVALVKAFYELARPTPLNEDQIVAQALQITNRRVIELEARNAELAPKADAFDGFIGAEGDYSINAAAKLLVRRGIKTGQNRLANLLLSWGWLYRGAKKELRAKQDHIETKRLAEKTFWIIDQNTGEKRAGRTSVRITPKGIDDIYQRINTDLEAAE